MGMFSWQCKECEQSILAPYNLTRTNAWMNEATAVLPDGKIATGTYDGYGRISAVKGIADINITSYAEDGTSSNDPDVYHLDCWRIAGRPIIYRGGSKSAADQGHFYEPDAYVMPAPKNKKDLSALKEARPS